MSGGFYLMHRGFWDDDSFKDEAFTEREAWHWLISNAAFEDCKHRHPVKYQFVEILRGQYPTSARELSRQWKWSISRVLRFLNFLQKSGKIETASDTHLTIISILNYNKYQGNRNHDEKKNETASRQPRDGLETDSEQHIDKQLKTNKTSISSLRSDIPAPARKKPTPGFSRPDWLDAQAWEDFEKMRKAIKKPLTDRARSAIVAKLERWRGQHDPTEILERSIVNCWQDIYEPKGQENGGFDGNSGKIGEADRGQSPQRLGGGAQAPKPSGGGWTGRAEAYAEKLKAGHRPPKLF